MSDFLSLISGPRRPIPALALFASVALWVAPLPGQDQAPMSPSTHPVDAEDFAEALGVKKVQLLEAPGLQVWCQDKAVLSALKKPLLAAWESAVATLPEPAPSDDLPYRVVVMAEAEGLEAYQPLFEAECRRAGISAPPASFFADAGRLGAGKWAYPPLVLVRSSSQSKQLVVTRAVHDLGGLRIGLAASEQGYGVPEFLIEGFAGALVRRAVPKPAALVSHAGAALKEKIHGYGVFAGIGAAMNDSSNHPGNWPASLRTAAKAWRKKEAIDPEERIDALLLRPKESFARSDYAYAWAVVEFLLEERYPVGAAAVEAAADRRWKPGPKVEPNRRAWLVEVFGVLRHQNYRMADPATRARLMLSFLEKRTEEDPEALHAAFQHWLDTGLPKK